MGLPRQNDEEYICTKLSLSNYGFGKKDRSMTICEWLFRPGPSSAVTLRPGEPD